MELPTAVKKKMDEAKAGMETSRPESPTPQPQEVSQPPADQTEPQAPVSAPPEKVATRLQPKAESGGEDWEHKYKVLQGMHKKETAELREKLAELEAKVSQLSVTPTANGPINLTDYGITPEQIEEYGEEYWETQVRIQENVVKAASQGSSAQSEELDQLKRKVEEQALERFYQRLDQKVPDWREVDRSAEWNDFLGQTDPASGLTNEDLLADAFEQYDADRVAALFSRHQATRSGSQTHSGNMNVAPQTKQAPSPQPGQSQGTMTHQQWMKEVNELPSKGLSPVAMVKEHDRLKALMREGRVTNVPGQPKDLSQTVGFV